MKQRVVTGIEDVTKRFDVIYTALVDATQKGLDETADDILQDSIDLTPIDTGNLVESAFVVSNNKRPSAVPTFNNKRKDSGALSAQYSWAVSYFGSLAKRFKNPTAYIVYSAYYANIIHEVNRNYNEGQWKFLQTALQNNSALLTRKVYMNTSTALGRL